MTCWGDILWVLCRVDPLGNWILLPLFTWLVASLTPTWHIYLSLFQFPRHCLGLMVKHLSPVCQAPGATLNPSKREACLGHQKHPCIPCAALCPWAALVITVGLQFNLVRSHLVSSTLRCFWFTRLTRDLLSLCRSAERRRDRPRSTSFSLHLYWLPEIGHAHHSLWGPVGMGTGQDSTSPVPLEIPCPRMFFSPSCHSLF